MITSQAHHSPPQKLDMPVRPSLSVNVCARHTPRTNASVHLRPVARHSSERYSSVKVFLFLASLLDVIGIPFSSALTSLLYELPNSRTQEYEGRSSHPRVHAETELGDVNLTFYTFPRSGQDWHPHLLPRMLQPRSRARVRLCLFVVPGALES